MGLQVLGGLDEAVGKVNACDRVGKEGQLKGGATDGAANVESSGNAALRRIDEGCDAPHGEIQRLAWRRHVAEDLLRRSVVEEEILVEKAVGLVGIRAQARRPFR